MWSKIIVFSVFLVAVHLAAGRSLQKEDEKTWLFDSDREIEHPSGRGKMPQIVCFGWYCKRTDRATAICKGKDFSKTPKVDYTCQIVDLDFTYKLSEYSVVCKDYNVPTNDHCYLNVTVVDAD